MFILIIVLQYIFMLLFACKFVCTHMGPLGQYSVAFEFYRFLFCFRRSFTLDEALHILLDENEKLSNTNLYIELPEPNVLTDD